MSSFIPVGQIMHDGAFRVFQRASPPNNNDDDDDDDDDDNNNISSDWEPVPGPKSMCLQSKYILPYFRANY